MAKHNGAKQIFKASDGSEHATKQAAQQRSEIVSAVRDFEAAGRKVVQLLGAAARTADGHEFVMGRLSDYWHVAWQHSGAPRLIRVSCWAHHCAVEFSNYQDPELSVRIFDDERRRDYVTYRVSELYWDEHAAREFHLKESLRYLDEVTAAIARLKPSS